MQTGQAGPYRGLSPQQQALVAAFKENPSSSITEAGKIAGYSSNISATRAFHSPNVQAEFRRAMKKANVSADHIARTIRRATLARKKVFFAHEGIVRDQRATPDHATRLSAAALAAKLSGFKESMEVEVTAGPLAELREEDLAMMERTLAGETVRDDEGKEIEKIMRELLSGEGGL